MRQHTKKTISTVLLALAFFASLAAGAVLPGMIALIPTFTAICSAIGFLEARTDWIWTY